MSKGTILAVALLLAATSGWAGGDNRVSMTDMKEALYNLVIDGKNEHGRIVDIDSRVSKIEPKMRDVDNNTQKVSMIINKLNALGVSTSSGDDEIGNAIATFVDQNRHLLPASSSGVR